LFFFVDTQRIIRRGPSNLAQIALTIDDGPDALLDDYLAALGRAQIPATFFCIGQKIEAEPDRVRAILRAGHEVQNHTFSHGHFLAMRSLQTNLGDLRRAQTLLAKLDVEPTYFRPVAGVVSPPVQHAAEKAELRVVHWTASARDGGPIEVPPNLALARLSSGLVPGGILVLHDRKHQHGPEIIALLAERGRARGLQFVTLSKLLSAS
jgi:peptidoglycan-N-acetylglucosamine deacetylase